MGKKYKYKDPELPNMFKFFESYNKIMDRLQSEMRETWHNISMRRAGYLIAPNISVEDET